MRAETSPGLGSTPQGSIRRIRGLSAELIRLDLRNDLLRLGLFLVRIWLAKAFLRFIFPLAVFLKRLAAARLVLILGTITPCW